jgi:hypothetical protein
MRLALCSNFYTRAPPAPGRVLKLKKLKKQLVNSVISLRSTEAPRLNNVPD